GPATTNAQLARSSATNPNRYFIPISPFSAAGRPILSPTEVHRGLRLCAVRHHSPLNGNTAFAHGLCHVCEGASPTDRRGWLVRKGPQTIGGPVRHCTNAIFRHG